MLRSWASRRLRGKSSPFLPLARSAAPAWPSATAAQASCLSTAVVAGGLLVIGAGSLFVLRRRDLPADSRWNLRPESLVPGDFSRVPRLSCQAEATAWAYTGSNLRWVNSTIYTRPHPGSGSDNHAAPWDSLATTRLGGRWAPTCQVVRLDAPSASFLGHQGKGAEAPVLALRVEEGVPPADAFEGGLVALELAPGRGLLELYGQPGLYRVQDQSLLRSSDLAKSGRYSAPDLFSGRRERVLRGLEALAEASAGEGVADAAAGKMQVLIADSVSTAGEASRMLGLASGANGAAEATPFLAAAAQLLDTSGDAHALLTSLLRAQCAAGPNMPPKAQELWEVLRRHGTPHPLGPEDLDAALARGFFSLSADESGMRTREREAERLLERARRELWAEGSASRRELELQIRHFLSWYVLGRAASSACIRLSFLRASSSPGSQDILARHRFAQLPGTSGLWWRLDLAPLQMSSL
eukprot:TRINITY_DN27587_c0_g1_i1.p1 TRINITY_DN27587_c0_g1~~TRINITY_DN27587_c0_g1_i1.p1  ORF type:complete len:476 (+),score=80.03 TRINITY_DN27587_c0_g1_i1:23-1429(+)